MIIVYYIKMDYLMLGVITPLFSNYDFAMIYNHVNVFTSFILINYWLIILL